MYADPNAMVHTHMQDRMREAETARVARRVRRETTTDGTASILLRIRSVRLWAPARLHHA